MTPLSRSHIWALQVHNLNLPDTRDALAALSYLETTVFIWGHINLLKVQKTFSRLSNIVQHNYIAGTFSKGGGGRKKKECLESILNNFTRSQSFAGSQCDLGVYKKPLLKILSKAVRMRYWDF